MVPVYKTLAVWSGGEWEGLASPQRKRMQGNIFRILQYFYDRALSTKSYSEAQIITWIKMNCYGLAILA